MQFLLSFVYRGCMIAVQGFEPLQGWYIFW